MGKLPTRTYRQIFLAEWMEALELGPVDLAKPYTSVTASYISNLARAARANPSALVMIEISEAMGITVNDIYKKPPGPGVVEALATISPTARQALLKAKTRK